MKKGEAMKKLSNRAVSHLLAAATFGVAAPLHAAAQDAGASSANSLASVEAIVVTAQRRAENVQKLSTPIAVLSGQDISRAGVTQPQDLNTVTPGLQLGMSGTTAQPYIRGVGNADNTGFAVSGVAFNVDGVYIAQPIAYGVSLFDLDRLEVLKGPQGTLYGRNATGGAINIITKQPSSQFGGYVGVDVNNYGLANVNGAVNLPVSDKIAVRAAFQIDDRNGYFKDGTNDDRSQKGRIRVKLTPTEDLTMLLNFEASHVGGAGPGGAEDIGASYNILRPWAGTLAPATVAAGYVTSNDTATRPFVDQNEYRINGELTWQANNFSFTLIPAYSHVSLVGINYADSFKLQTVSNTYDEKSIEGRVGYESDKLKWVFGLYYFDQHQTVNFTVDYHVLGITSSNPKINTESYAAFTQGTYSLTGSLRAIGGVRYSHEDQAGYGV